MSLDGGHILDALTPVRKAGSAVSPSLASRQLRWDEEWWSRTGAGVRLGLVDTHFDEGHPDLAGADIVARNFANMRSLGGRLLQHGTFSATTMVGQGRKLIQGIAPKARLLVATVVGSNGIAEVSSVRRAIEWLLENDVRIIALPIGGGTELPEFAEVLRSATINGAIFFAAAGDGWSNKLLFPASDRHSVAVAACDDDGVLSFHGEDTSLIELVAPGWNIIGSVTAERIVERSGSSIACVIASAVAGLAVSTRGGHSMGWDRHSLLRTIRGTDSPEKEE